jgi:hypothetical protein
LASAKHQLDKSDPTHPEANIAILHRGCKDRAITFCIMTHVLEVIVDFSAELATSLIS